MKNIINYRKRSRKLYLQSLFNAIYLNNLLRNLNSKEYQKYLGLSNKYEHLLWLLVLFLPFFILARFIKAVFGVIKNKRVELKPGDYFLAASVALSRVAKHANVIGEEYRWLDLPFTDTKVINEKYKISYFNLLSISDLCICCADSYATLFYSFKKYGLKYIFYNLYSIDWFIYYHMTQKIPCGSRVFFCNHKDKWVTLLDSLEGCSKIFIQHGTEMIRNEVNADKQTMKYLNNPGCWIMDMPYKYRNIDFAYIFTENEFFALNAAIFHRIPEYSIIGYEMKLAKRLTSGKSLLIIGFFREYGEYEKKVIELLKDEELSIYIKNHPTVDVNVYSIFSEYNNVHIINEAIFPDVDIVISYESTLALEYESYGIKVLYYNDFNAQFNNLKTIVNKYL